MTVFVLNILEFYLIYKFTDRRFGNQFPEITVLLCEVPVV